MRIHKTNPSTVKAAAEPAVEKKADYSDAIAAIRSAIEALGDVAKSGDTLARESIANLSVILFDLQ